MVPIFIITIILQFHPMQRMHMTERNKQKMVWRIEWDRVLKGNKAWEFVQLDKIIKWYGSMRSTSLFCIAVLEGPPKWVNSIGNVYKSVTTWKLSGNPRVVLRIWSRVFVHTTHWHVVKSNLHRQISSYKDPLLLLCVWDPFTK